jgi:hypothetical protein
MKESISLSSVCFLCVSLSYFLLSLSFSFISLFVSLWQWVQENSDTANIYRIGSFRLNAVRRNVAAPAEKKMASHVLLLTSDEKEKSMELKEKRLQNLFQFLSHTSGREC